jgi:hypothetical protein
VYSWDNRRPDCMSMSAHTSASMSLRLVEFLRIFGEFGLVEARKSVSMSPGLIRILSFIRIVKAA